MSVYNDLYTGGVLPPDEWDDLEEEFGPDYHYGNYNPAPMDSDYGYGLGGTYGPSQAQYGPPGSYQQPPMHTTAMRTAYQGGRVFNHLPGYQPQPTYAQPPMQPHMQPSQMQPTHMPAPTVGHPPPRPGQQVHGARLRFGQQQPVVSGARLSFGPQQPVVSGARLSFGPQHPVVSGARMNFHGGPIAPIRIRLVGSGGSGVNTGHMNNRRGARAQRITEQLFLQTKQLIHQDLQAAGTANLPPHVDHLQIKINYTRQEATWTDTMGNTHKIDLASGSPLRSGQQIRGLMAETMKINKPLAWGTGGRFYETSAHHQGPLTNKTAFLAPMGVGDTFASFAKNDLGRLRQNATPQQRQTMLAQMSTASLYRDGMIKKVTGTINHINQEITRLRRANPNNPRIADLVHDKQILEARLAKLRNTRLDPAFFLATQNPPPGLNAVQRAEYIEREAERYLHDELKVSKQRTWTRPWGQVADLQAHHKRYCRGIGAMSIPTTDKTTFNTYAARVGMRHDVHTGYEKALLVDNMAHITALARQPAGNPIPLQLQGSELFTDGLKDAAIQGRLQQGQTQVQHEAVGLHRSLTAGNMVALRKDSDAITRSEQQLDQAKARITL